MLARKRGNVFSIPEIVLLEQIFISTCCFSCMRAVKCEHSPQWVWSDVLHCSRCVCYKPRAVAFTSATFSKSIGGQDQTCQHFRFPQVWSVLQGYLPALSYFVVSPRKVLDFEQPSVFIMNRKPAKLTHLAHLSAYTVALCGNK